MIINKEEDAKFILKLLNKFKNERNTDYTSASLEISFHEKQGNKISITKSSPVPDSIGLSSTAYTLTVTNNLTIPVNYKLILVPDENEIALDGCAESQIPLDIVKVALKEKSITRFFHFRIHQQYQPFLIKNHRACPIWKSSYLHALIKLKRLNIGHLFHSLFEL